LFHRVQARRARSDSPTANRLDPVGLMGFRRCRAEPDVDAALTRQRRGVGTSVFYETRFTPGGCHVPSPAGSIEGASLFGQYNRKTR
jgi:hypothetical protein